MELGGAEVRGKALNSKLGGLISTSPSVQEACKSPRPLASLGGSSLTFVRFTEYLVLSSAKVNL